MLQDAAKALLYGCELVKEGVARLLGGCKVMLGVTKGLLGCY